MTVIWCLKVECVGFQVRGKGFKGDLKYKYFAQRVVDIGNELSEMMKATAFKRHLDLYLKEQGIERCGINVGKWD